MSFITGAYRTRSVNPNAYTPLPSEDDLAPSSDSGPGHYYQAGTPKHKLEFFLDREESRKEIEDQSLITAPHQESTSIAHIDVVEDSKKDSFFQEKKNSFFEANAARLQAEHEVMQMRKASMAALSRVDKAKESVSNAEKKLETFRAEKEKKIVAAENPSLIKKISLYFTQNSESDDEGDGSIHQKEFQTLQATLTNDLRLHEFQLQAAKKNLTEAQREFDKA